MHIKERMVKRSDVACMVRAMGTLALWQCQVMYADVPQTWQSVVTLDLALLGRPSPGHPGRNRCALGVGEANCQYY